MKKSAHGRAKDRAWYWFAKFIKLRDCLKTTGTDHMFYCISCARPKELGHGGHAGHLVSGRHNSVLFDEDGVNAQCAYCNDHLKGNYAEYRPRLVKKIGEDRVKACESRKHEAKTFTEEDLRTISAEFRKKYHDLEEKA